MKVYVKKKESICGRFLYVCEASVSRAVFIVVKPTFDLVAFISAKTFVL